MSAYIVAPETIHRVVGALLDAPEHGYHARQVGGFNLVREAADALGTALLALNTNAVDQRYNERNPRPVYHFQRVPCDRLQQYASVRCLLYQMSEGDVPEEPLYQELEAFSNWQAHRLVTSSKAWERTTWG